MKLQNLIKYCFLRPGVPEEEAGLLKISSGNTGLLKVFLAFALDSAIGEVYGGTLSNLDKVYHGVAQWVKRWLMTNFYLKVLEEFEVGRYHSWVVDPTLPEELEATSLMKMDKCPCATERLTSAVQFHPESVLTQTGKNIENWVNS
jgi:anthranilate synthase component 2